MGCWICVIRLCLTTASAWIRSQNWPTQRNNYMSDKVWPGSFWNFLHRILVHWSGIVKTFFLLREVLEKWKAVWGADWGHGKWDTFPEQRAESNWLVLEAAFHPHSCHRAPVHKSKWILPAQSASSVPFHPWYKTPNLCITHFIHTGHLWSGPSLSSLLYHSLPALL